VDPNSGTTALLEMARGLAAARKAGWQPRRTVVLASWDGEEYGLLGSTEWGEDHAEELRRKAVAYINVDVAVTGSQLGMGGAPSLRALAREVAALVSEPLHGGSVGAAWEKRERAQWAHAAPVDLGQPDPPFELRLDPLGSGSDYTVFLDHLGVPSLDFGFSGKYGVYHSVYDNFRWMEKFGDPEFIYHAAAARLFGLLAMRLSSADVVPLRFSSYAGDLRVELDALRRDAIRRARIQPEPGSAEKPPLQPDFTALLRALDGLDAAGRAADRASDAVAARGDAEAAARINNELIQVERAFLAEGGLPGRPWFRHLLVAPGTTTGYAPWPFPGLVQALEDRDADSFASQATAIAKALDAASERLRAAAAVAGP